jgi:hypothetical protein
MATQEDALKAVEMLTEIMRGVFQQPELRVRWIEELNALRMGCEAIRMDQRQSGFAQNIIQRPLPPGAPPMKGFPGLTPLTS